MNQKPKKFIFVTGGVMSSIGKGISAASTGMLLERRGIKVTMIKMDPYLNVDPGTMSPVQHGEVFVLDDGSETDLDLGHYSRFVENARFTKRNSFTSGRIYESVIKRERSGGYLGKTVQVIPHITDEIKSWIHRATADSDLAIIEVGGTVGDIESQPFLEAIRQMKHDLNTLGPGAPNAGGQNVLFMHVTFVPYVAAAEELKTKPTQHSVRDLREIGIQPDILLCRSDRVLPQEVREKIGLFCNMSADCVFSAVDCKSIYEVPLLFHEQGVDEQITQKLGIWSGRPNIQAWKQMIDDLRSPEAEIKIALVGKYIDARDSYKSLSESLVHGGVANRVKVVTEFVDSEEIESKGVGLLNGFNGILVPGGFGARGVEGKIQAIQFARENQIPFFGICLGMQMAVVEYARNQCDIGQAGSSEFDGKEVEPVIDLMQSQQGVERKGGTMRLGAYSCRVLKKTPEGMATRAFEAYQKETVEERHRHRFEVSNHFRTTLEKNGLIVSGRHVDESKQLDLVEMIELENHPWFLGCQFHPEFLSRPLKPHPLFVKFIEAVKGNAS